MHFIIKGTPKSKQSARFASIPGRGIRSYQKKSVVELGVSIKNEIRSQLPDGFKIWDCPVFVKSVLFVFPPLKSWSKKKLKRLYEGELFYKTTKPDLMDNLNKQVFDCMEGVVFANDSRICRVGEMNKIYGTDPRTEIIIEPIV